MTAAASILIVDDSPSIRKMVRAALGSARFAVIEAVDGCDALEKAMAQPFDLVLTDQNMPGMDGIALTRKLRQQPHLSSTPIIILTTESGAPLKQAGRSAGATGWMVKPFDPATLVQVVRQLTA